MCSQPGLRPHRKTAWLRASLSVVETELNMVQLHHITKEMDLHLLPSRRSWARAVIPWLHGTHLQEPLSSVELFQVSPVEHGGVLVGSLWKHLLHVCCSPESLVVHQKGHPIIAANTHPVTGGGEKSPFPLQPLSHQNPREGLNQPKKSPASSRGKSLLDTCWMLAAVHASSTSPHYALKNFKLRCLPQDHPP